MLLTLGILCLFSGGILLAASTPRFVFTRGVTNGSFPFSVKLFLGALGLIAIAVFMIHKGQEQGIGGISFGIVFFFTGMVVSSLGVWMGIWGPVSSRNTNKGLQFILIGLVLLVFGIVSMTIKSMPSFSSNPAISYHHGLDLDYLFSHQMGPIPFGLFAIVMFILVNGLSLKNRQNPKRIIGSNIVMLAMLILLYSLGPTLFHTW